MENSHIGMVSSVGKKSILCLFVQNHVFRFLPERSFMVYGLFTKGCPHGSGRMSNSWCVTSPVGTGVSD